jgi:hypothetical protein
MSLVTSTNLLRALGEVAMDTLRYVRGLLLNVDKHLAVISIKADIIGHKTNATASIPDNLLIVNIGLGGDLTKDHDHTSLGSRLASNLGKGIVTETGIENGVGNLISDLVWVSLTNRLRLIDVISAMVMLPRRRKENLTVKRKVPWLWWDLTPLVPLTPLVAGMIAMLGGKSIRV